ncbi:MAG: luciferase-like protein [Acidimicrobiaceae bacterium]|nr:luciferase-like protein [Acidimicrobiaceae bacterium]
MKIGYSLSAEQFSPSELLDQARRARDAGFEALAISDHYHPWNEAQGNSAFVWSIIGALSQSTPELPVSTMVTCPIVRINPVILAQAAATAAVLLNGNFVFGVGTGENLNEHVWGAPWPPATERIARLREAIDLMRLLWTGENIDFDGDYYRAVNARIYTLPDEPPPVYVSGLAPLSTELAADVADGFVTFSPELLTQYRRSGGRGVAQTAMKVCFDVDEVQAVGDAYRLWATELNPGQLNRELAQPRHIESAASMVTPEMVAEHFTCGSDPDRHVAAIEERIDAGYDEIYVQQVGADMDGFFNLYGSRVLPVLRTGGTRRSESSHR